MYEKRCDLQQRSGVIDGIIHRMKEELGGKATVIATGGLARKSFRIEGEM